jgi:hypothetical protein
LGWYFKYNPPKEGEEKIPIKISFDNARVTTSNSTKKNSNGVFEDMRNSTKKNSNGFHFIIYIGNETEQTLEEELADV